MREHSVNLPTMCMLPEAIVRCPRERLTEDKLPKKTHRRLQANLQ